MVTLIFATGLVFLLSIVESVFTDFESRSTWFTVVSGVILASLMLSRIKVCL